MKKKRKSNKIENTNLADAIFPNGVMGQTQLSQTDTLFKNLRYYLVSNNRNLLSELYIENALVQTICDLPVDDALRGGVKITTDELDDEEIKDLETYMDRHDDINIIGQTAKWNRLFGGAATLIITDQDPASELDIDAIKEGSKLEFRALDLWELYPRKIAEIEAVDTNDLIPTNERLNHAETYSYYNQIVHRSRLMIMEGLSSPSFMRPRLRGWGLSVLESLVRSMNQYYKATDLAFEVLDEFKVDIFKIKGLIAALAAVGGTAKIQTRISLANMQKNYLKAIAMDADDSYDQKQMTFSGIADIMKEIRNQIASDMRIPQTKLFGQSSAGFNSGEDDIEVYNAMIESTIRSKIKYHLLRMIEMRCKHKYGFIPDDLSIEFESLRVLSAEGEENVKNAQFNRVIQAKQAGEITSQEFRDGVNRDQLLPNKLDENVDLSQEDSEENGASDEQI